MHLTNSKLVTQMISFCRHQSFLLFSLLVLLASFSLSAQTSPTVTLTDTDSDNILSASDTVTITAAFSKAMVATPTISITGAVTDVAMTLYSNEHSTFNLLDKTNVPFDAPSNYNSTIYFYVQPRIATNFDGSYFARRTFGKTYIYKNNSLELESQKDSEINANYTDDLSSDYSMMKFSSNGQTLAYTSARDNTNAASKNLYYYDRDSNGNWTKNSLPSPSNLRGDNYSTFDLSSDGLTIVAQRHTHQNFVYNYEIVLFQRSSTSETFSETTSFTISLSTKRIWYNETNDRIIVWVNDDPTGLELYELIGSTYTSQGYIWREAVNAYGSLMDESGFDFYYNSNIDFNNDLTLFVIGNNSVNIGSNDSTGKVGIYSLSDTTSQVTELQIIDGSEDKTWGQGYDYFGSIIDISDDGNVLSVSGGNASKLYTYTKINGSFVQKSKFGYTESYLEQFEYSPRQDRLVEGMIDKIALQGNGESVFVGGYPYWYTSNYQQLNGYTSKISTNIYNYNWDVDKETTPPDGDYIATVAGTASATSIAYSGTDSITFTIDSTAPTVTLTDTDSDNFLNVSQVVTITAGFSEAMTSTPTISITGIVTNVIMTPVSGTNSYTFAWDTSSGTLSEGTYSATVSGTDLVGNAYVSGTQSITFTLDTSAPTVTITSGDSDNTVKSADSNITLTATFNEAMASAPTISITGVVTNVALTASSSSTWTYDWNISSVTEGSYTVTVTGTDLAGNTYAGTDSITLTVDNSVPGVLLVSDNTDSIIGSTGVVSISAYFSETLSTSPTLSISGLVTDTVMSKFSRTPINQIGQLINDGAGAKLGWTSDISESGNRIIVGAPYGSSTSFARVYQWNGKQWEQLGNEITGTSSNNLGRPVGISGDGSVIVVGEKGTVNANDLIYKIYTLSGSSWTLRETINDDNVGVNDDPESGSVDLSYDGSIFAFSHGLNDANIRGQARIFEWDNTNYIQMGSDILGDADDAILGAGHNGISLTKDGKRIVVGLRTRENSVNGKVRVYDWDGAAWTQVGGDITDPAGTAMSLGTSVSISNDGQTIIAGAPNRQDDSTSPEKVLIFSYQLISGTASWTYKASISGSTNGDNFGYSSSINGNGDKIIVGAYDGNFTTPGYARIYSWDGTTASQIGSDIVGDTNGDAFGAHVELSANGIAIISAPLSDSGGSDSGEVKVIGTDRYEYSWDVDSGGAPSDGSYTATVAGSDLVGNAYSGTDSITFTLDTSGPTVTLTDTDADNIISTTLSPTNTVTITASFSEAMTATPTVFITGVVTNVAMTKVGSTNSYTYNWNTSTPTLAAGAYSVTVSGTDAIGNAYVGTDSVTFTISPTFYLDSNGVTVKCRGCNAGDTGMVSGTLYTAVENGTGTNGIKTLVNAGNYNLATTLVTDMSDLFDGNTSFNTDIGFWDTSNVTTFESMFANTSFNQDISNWDTSKVTNMSYMFYKAYVFNQNISSWDTSKVTNMSYMFYGYTAGTNNRTSFNNGQSTDPSDGTLGWDTSSVTNMENMFYYSRFNQNIGSWDTSNVTDMSGMFYQTTHFNKNIGSWDTSSVTDMNNMFGFAYEFNQNISSWDTSNVTDMSGMFINAIDFNNGDAQYVANTPLSWDTSEVTNMSEMFQDATIFNQYIGNWDVSKVTDMSHMFEASSIYTSSLFNNGTVIGTSGTWVDPIYTMNWDVSSVTNMEWMFYNNRSFNNDITRWDVSSVTNMDYFVPGSDLFHQDLSRWCVTQIASPPDSFASTSFLYDTGFDSPAHATEGSWITLYSKHPQWGTCPDPASDATLVLTSDDSDNIITTSQVTLTATFSLSMSPTPTISISGVVTNVAMTQTSTDTVWTYFWQVPGSITSETDLNVTATAIDTNSRTYVGTESLTLTIDSFGPTLSFSDTDTDNLLSATDSVTITAVFNESMSATPTILISGSGTSTSSVMTQISGTNSYTFNWDLSGSSLNDGTYTATVSGTDLASNPYSGTESITFTLDTSGPTVTLTDTDADNIISTTLSPTNTVTITASFSEAMTATPTVFITGVVTNVVMTRVGSTNNYTENWNTSTP